MISFENCVLANYMKKIKENLITLDAPWLKKKGYFLGYKSGGITWTHGASGLKEHISIIIDLTSINPYIKFFGVQIDQNGQKKDVEYEYPLTKTPCNYGGKRWWLICAFEGNGKICNRRVNNLYMSESSGLFACRHCQNLTYES